MSIVLSLHPSLLGIRSATMSLSLEFLMLLLLLLIFVWYVFIFHYVLLLFCLFCWSPLLIMHPFEIIAHCSMCVCMCVLCLLSLYLHGGRGLVDYVLLLTGCFILLVAGAPFALGVLPPALLVSVVLIFTVASLPLLWCRGCPLPHCHLCH